MKRRALLFGIAGLAAGTFSGKPARGQRQALIGLVNSGSAESSRAREASLAEGLRELGHVPERTFRLEQRVWNGDPNTIQPLLREVLAAKPDLLVVGGLGVVQAARRATSSTPIVVTNASDLVSYGIVRSYARPGGNVTGFTTLTDVITGKRLEVLLEAVPAVRKVALLQNPTQPQAKSVEVHTRSVAAKLRIELPVVNAVNRRELEAALDKPGETRAEGVLVASHGLFRHHSAMLIERALKHKAFVVHWLPYAADQGARPGDLPIEQVTSDELIVNLRTARTLGLKVSQTVLLRASRVIH